MRPDMADGLISSGLVTNRKEFDDVSGLVCRFSDRPAPAYIPPPLPAEEQVA